MRTIECTMCGKTVEVDDRARHAKYCPDCMDLAKKLYSARQSAKRREKRARAMEVEDSLGAMDAPENIAICLSCPLPKCRQSTVSCPLRRNGGAV